MPARGWCRLLAAASWVLVTAGLLTGCGGSTSRASATPAPAPSSRFFRTPPGTTNVGLNGQVGYVLARDMLLTEGWTPDSGIILGTDDRGCIFAEHAPGADYPSYYGHAFQFQFQAGARGEWEIAGDLQDADYPPLLSTCASGENGPAPSPATLPSTQVVDEITNEALQDMNGQIARLGPLTLVAPDLAAACVETSPLQSQGEIPNHFFLEPLIWTGDRWAAYLGEGTDGFWSELIDYDTFHSLSSCPAPGSMNDNIAFPSITAPLSGTQFPAPTSAQPPAESTNFDWARWVLRDGNWPQSSNNTTVITQWMASEEPVSDWWDRNNPLNNGLGSGGGSGLGSYSNLLDAAAFAAQNLRQGTSNYGTIDADLAASAPPATTASAIWNSPWASSHYGYGKRWHSGPVATATAPSSAW